MDLKTFNKVKKDLKIENIQNLDVKAKWIELGIRLKIDGYVEKADEDILGKFGRVKYLKPIYRALIDTDQQAKAKEIYDSHEAFYAPKARNALKPIVNPPTPPTPPPPSMT